MALKIYDQPNPDSYFTVGDKKRPLFHVFDGISGGVRYQRYYIRNDDATKYYTTIKVQPILLSGFDIITTSGFSWKLLSGDKRPLTIEWENISTGNQLEIKDQDSNYIDLGSSGSSNTYSFLPFWLRLEVPGNVPLQVFENVTLRITADEFDV